MSLCRITALCNGFSYRAKSTAGTWRTLAEGDSLATGESVEIFSHGARFNFTAAVLQNKVSGLWVDAVSLVLNLPSGTSHKRVDLLTIAGDATDSTVTQEITSKGHHIAKRQHFAQISNEERRGVKFGWNGSQWAGVLSEVARERDFGQGGYLEGIEARLVCNREQFADAGAMPVTGQPIDLGPERYVISSLEIGDAAFTFDLGRNNNA